MDNEVEKQGTEKAPGPAEPPESSQAFQEVAQIGKAVGETVEQTPLSQKMDDLHIILENLSEEVDGWRAWHKNDYLAAIETLKSHVQEIRSDWNDVSTNLKSQRDRLESLLESFPGVIETATLKALSLRVGHLERLVSQLLSESTAKTTATGTRKQMIISLVALGVTVTFWGVFIALNVFGC